MRKLTECFLLLPFVIFGSYAANAQTAEQYNKLDESIEKVEGLQLPNEARTIVNGIRKNFLFLTNKWISAGQKELPGDYLMTLDEDTKALLSVPHIESPQKIANLLTLVRSDLDLKVRSAKRGTNAAEDQGATRTVIVRTFKEGNEIGGYTVICNTSLHANNPNSQFPFNNQTSPTGRTLSPGLYWIRIEKNGRKFAEGKAEIGDQDPEEIKFQIP
jgi:hypothetical protein